MTMNLEPPGVYLVVYWTRDHDTVATGIFSTLDLAKTKAWKTHDETKCDVSILFWTVDGERGDIWILNETDFHHYPKK